MHEQPVHRDNGLAAGWTWRWSAGFASAAVAWIALCVVPYDAHAQITVDGSLGPAGSLTGPNYVIGSNLGQISSNGKNLFHSFGQFNLRGQFGESAVFTGPSTIANVLSRVTGGQASLIEGLIDTRTAMPNANFFFINPSGVILGAGASLNVGGSVHFSTADYVRFADGRQFFGRLTGNDVLSAADPSAFGFLGPSGASVSVQPGAVLSVDPGKTLSLVGGPVTVSGATLSAPGGRVEIAAAASAGELPIGNVAAGSVPQFGRVEVSGGSVVDATGDPGGTVVIRAGQLIVDGAGTTVSTGTTSLDGALVGIDLLGQQSLDITGGALVQTVTSGPGRGGDVRLKGGAVVISDAVIATASVTGEGVGGDVTVDGSTVAVTTGGSIQSFQLDPNFFARGRGGNIALRADDAITISGVNGGGAASLLASVTDSAGNGGAISIVGASLTMDGGQILSSGTFGEGPNLERPGGTSGLINVDVTRLILSGGALVRSFVTTTSPGVPGRAGSVTVAAAGHADISGPGTGIFSFANQASPADLTIPGDILVNVGTLRLADGALIQGGSPGVDSQGGNVTVRAADSIVISEGAGISSQAFNLAVGAITVSAQNTLTIDRGFINTGTVGDGRAGDITIDAGSLSLLRGGQVASSSSALATGAGGSVTVNAQTAVTISGNAPASVLPVPFSFFIDETASGIFSNAFSRSPQAGAAGSIAVLTPVLTMTQGGKISVATSGAGRAGGILVNAGTNGTVSLDSGAKLDSGTTAAGAGGDITVTAGTVTGTGTGTGLFSTASSTGNAGSVTVSATTLDLNSGAELSVATSGAGDAGDIGVSIGTLTLGSRAVIDSSTTGAGRGGDLAVNATDFVSMSSLGAGLFSTAESTGAAGRITVAAPALTVIDGAKISVATSGAGNAGDIGLSIGTLTLGAGGLIDSSTTSAGRGGDLVVNAVSPVSIAGPGTGLFSTASSVGNAGRITISGPTLSLIDGAKISVATSGAGNAGDIALNVASVTLDGAAVIDSSTTGAGRGGDLAITAANPVSISGSGTGLFSTAENTGAAGRITLSAPALSLTSGARVSVETSGAGNAGDIALNVNAFLLAGDARVDSSTSGAGRGGTITLSAGGFTVGGAGMFSDASGTGAGGDINIAAQTATLTNATISATSTGSAEATAGNINLLFGSSLDMQSSKITTNSLLADGGNISITATGSLLHLTNSAITTSVQSGLGSGGNITVGSQLHPLEFIILNGSEIRADAFGGPGGNINVHGDVFLTQKTIISASSALSSPGTIAIQAQFTDVTGALAQLPESILQAAALLRASCAARLAQGKTSSLLVAGREGVPPAPDGLLPSPVLELGSGVLSQSEPLLRLAPYAAPVGLRSRCEG